VHPGPPEVCPCFRDAILKWLPIADQLNSLRGRLAELQSIEVPSTVTRNLKSGENSAQLEHQLAGQERSVAALYDNSKPRTAEAEIAATTIEQHQRRFEEVQRLAKGPKSWIE